MNLKLDGLSRRAFLANGMGAVTAVALRPSVAHAASEDPRKSGEGQVRMRSTLDDSIAIWSYSGSVYAIRPAQQPLRILSLAGCQTQWAKRLENGAWRMAGMLLTYFRDIHTGEFLESWSNPFTGKRLAVGVNRFAGGSSIYPADGSAMYVEGSIAASESAPQGFKEETGNKPVGLVQWSMTADKVLLQTDHSFNVRVQPQTEAHSLFAERSAFFDPDVRRLPATYTGSTIIPWMRWMDMADVPGHLMWHSSGEKLFSIDQLPSDYRAHAGALVDDLAQRPSSLDRLPE